MDSIKADTSYWVDVVCPQCGETDTVPLHLAARIEKTRDEAKLGVKAGSKKVDHRCGQTTLTVVAETGEIVQLGLDA